MPKRARRRRRCRQCWKVSCKREEAGSVSASRWDYRERNQANPVYSPHGPKTLAANWEFEGSRYRHETRFYQELEAEVDGQDAHYWCRGPVGVVAEDASDVVYCRVLSRAEVFKEASLAGESYGRCAGLYTSLQLAQSRLRIELARGWRALSVERARFVMMWTWSFPGEAMIRR